MTEAQVKKSSGFVTVACKLPMGMQLTLCEPFEGTEQTPNGIRNVKSYRKVGDSIYVAGPAMPVGVPDAPKKKIEWGYALTRNVPADFWAKWFEQNKDADYVKNGIIFACPSRDEAEDRAAEQENITSGLEPLNPAITQAKDGTIIPVDPRYPKSMPGVAAIHTGER